MTYIPGGPRPAGPLPEIATARQAEVAQEVGRQHEAREAREGGRERHHDAPWWRRMFRRRPAAR
jgi:hypothetical protein